jgi:hypothetical protein
LLNSFFAHNLIISGQTGESVRRLVGKAAGPRC